MVRARIKIWFGWEAPLWVHFLEFESEGVGGEAPQSGIDSAKGRTGGCLEIRSKPCLQGDECVWFIPVAIFTEGCQSESV